jgi:acrylyl-CoA reductase (NADPH)
MPPILRGVTLYGINSVYVDNVKRQKARAMLAQHVEPAKLQQMTHEII